MLKEKEKIETNLTNLIHQVDNILNVIREYSDLVKNGEIILNLDKIKEWMIEFTQCDNISCHLCQYRSICKILISLSLLTHALSKISISEKQTNLIKH